jgi:hypothetical protein
VSKSTLKTYKKTVWVSFAKYIKARDAGKDGMCQCCTCGKFLAWNDAQTHAGHFIGGRNNAVLFDEGIVHAQCSGCNKYGGGKPWDYEQFMMNRYGYDYGTLEEIKARRNQVKKYTMDELKALNRHYSSEFERIKKEKGL